MPSPFFGLSATSVSVSDVGCGNRLGGLIPDSTIPLPSFSRTSCWVRCLTGIVVVLLFGEGRLQICRSDANTTALQYLRSTNPRSLYLAVTSLNPGRLFFQYGEYTVANLACSAKAFLPKAERNPRSGCRICRDNFLEFVL